MIPIGVLMKEHERYIPMQVNRKQIRDFSLSVTSLFLCVSLIGCGSTGGSTASESGSENSKDMTVSFQTWNLKNETYTPYFEKLIKQFEAANKGVTVKWQDQPAENYDQKLSTDAAAGQLPDVINVSETQAYNLAKSGALLNLSREASGMSKDYLPQVWGGSEFSGKSIEKGVYGFPWYMNIDVAYINKDVYARCGLDVNKPPKTYEDLFAQGESLSKSCGGGSYLLAIPRILPSEFAEFGVKFLNNDRTKYIFNSEKGIEYVQHYVDLYKLGVIPRDGLNSNTVTAENLYYRGDIAYMPDSTSSVAAFKANAPDLYKKLDVAPLVTNTKNTLNPMLMSVNSQTKHKEMAIKLANYLTNKENQIEFSVKSNTFPSAAGAMDSPRFTKFDESTLEGKVLKVAKFEIENGTVANFPPEVSDTDGANYMSPEIIRAVQGEQSPKQALDQAVKALNERLDQ